MLLEITSGPAKILLKINGELSLKKKIFYDLINSKFWRAYIPDVSLTFLKSNRQIKGYCGELIYTPVNTKLPKFQLSAFLAKLEGKWGQIKCEDLITTAEYLLERLRQEKEVYCFHGSCAEVGGKGILIFGDTTGLGKTLLALLLSQHEGNYFISDEKFLLNPRRLEIKGGVWTIPAKNIYLAKLLKCRIGDSFPLYSSSKWKKKLKSNTKLSLIISPRLHSSFNSAGLYRWEQPITEWHLYEEMSRKIRGVSRRIVNSSFPLLSIDSQKIAERRSVWSKIISQKIPAYVVYGNPHMAINLIHKLCERKSERKK